MREWGRKMKGSKGLNLNLPHTHSRYYAINSETVAHEIWSFKCAFSAYVWTHVKPTLQGSRPFRKNMASLALGVGSSCLMQMNHGTWWGRPHSDKGACPGLSMVKVLRPLLCSQRNLSRSHFFKGGGTRTRTGLQWSLISSVHLNWLLTFASGSLGDQSSPNSKPQFSRESRRQCENELKRLVNLEKWLSFSESAPFGFRICQWHVQTRENDLSISLH